MDAQAFANQYHHADNSRMIGHRQKYRGPHDLGCPTVGDDSLINAAQHLPEWQSHEDLLDAQQATQAPAEHHTADDGGDGHGTIDKGSRLQKPRISHVAQHHHCRQNRQSKQTDAPINKNREEGFVRRL